MDDLIRRQAAINALHDEIVRRRIDEDTNDDGALDEFDTEEILRQLPSAQSDIAEKLYLCKCYVTDEEGLQHEVIHTGDIRRITGWEI